MPSKSLLSRSQNDLFLLGVARDSILRLHAETRVYAKEVCVYVCVCFHITINYSNLLCNRRYADK